VAVITGAGSGIGRAVAERLAAEGAVVVAADIDAASAQHTVSSLPSSSFGDHLAIVVDVADSGQVATLFRQVDQLFGRLDVLVCNAAVSRTPGDGRDVRDQLARERSIQLSNGEEPTSSPDHLVHMSDDGWHRMLAVNLHGVFYCCRDALAVMNRQNSGAIVCVSSIAAQSGTGPPHYAAAKGGVISLVRSLALEVAPRGIRVNAVAPGPIDTPMMRAATANAHVPDLVQRMPLGRVGQPDDVAAAIAYLASSEAGFITGAVIPVNGGLFIG